MDKRQWSRDIRYPPGSSQLWAELLLATWQDDHGADGAGEIVLRAWELCRAVVHVHSPPPRGRPASTHTAAQVIVWRCLGCGAGYDAGGKQPWSRDDSQRDERRGAGAGRHMRWRP